MTTVTTTELAPDNTRRLIELARAFKAIGSPGHQHHACRIVDVTSASQLSAPLRIGALPDRLLLEGALQDGEPSAIVAPVDPTTLGSDPLTLL
jgi:hypothetical protein